MKLSKAARLFIIIALFILPALFTACGDAGISIDGDLDFESIAVDGDFSEGEDSKSEIEENDQTCFDNDPCTFDEFDANLDECKFLPICNEPNKNICILADDSIKCTCNQGYTLDGDECIPEIVLDGLSCETPFELDIDSSGLSGNTSDGNSNYKALCSLGQEIGSELIYSFDLSERKYANFYLTGDNLLIYVRSICDDRLSEKICETEKESTYLSAGAALDAGQYFLFIDSQNAGGEFHLEYEFLADPCSDRVCGDEQLCVTSDDWHDYECTCTDGKLPYNDTCIKNPCEPNPCLAQNQNICKTKLPENFDCECNPGYMFDDTENCIADPEANDWAFLVYMNGDNDLESAAYSDLEEMVLAGSTDNVHIFVMLDTATRDEGKTRYLYISKTGWEVIEELPEADMSDWHSLADFGKYGTDKYFARHYALILWDHGTGWLKSGDMEQEGIKGFSSDENGSSHTEISISHGQFTSALAEITAQLGRKLDIVGFDACWMGLWELAEASREHALFFIASQDVIPNTGWPYDKFLVPLTENPKLTAEAFASSIVQSYHDAQYNNSTLSVIDLKTLDDLAEKIDSLAGELLLNKEDYPKIEQARQNSQSFFKFETYRDLKDFALNISLIDDISPSLKAASEELVTQLESTIVFNRAKDDFPRANGLTIYAPGSDGWVHPNYFFETAPWYNRTRWPDFLLDFAGLPEQ